MNNLPHISVYITTKNRLELLKRALHSVLLQSYQKIEIIVINDGSTDGTDEYLYSISGKYKNLKYITNNKSIGACAARNLAVNISTGEYITGLDDDDVFTKNRIECFVGKIYLLNKYSFLFSNREINNIPQKSMKVVNETSILYKNHVGNQIFIEKSKLVDIGGFNKDMPAWQDYELWIRLISKYGSAINVNKCTYLVYPSRDSISVSKERIELASKLFSINFRDIYPKHPIQQMIYLNKHQYPMFGYPKLSKSVLLSEPKLWVRYCHVVLSRIKISLLTGE
ncbi:glycosyltransferase family 2 protein [Vibrio cyclitrophicus]